MAKIPIKVTKKIRRIVRKKADDGSVVEAAEALADDEVESAESAEFAASADAAEVAEEVEVVDEADASSPEPDEPAPPAPPPVAAANRPPTVVVNRPPAKPANLPPADPASRPRTVVLAGRAPAAAAPAVAVALPVDDDEGGPQPATQRMDPGRVAGNWRVEMPQPSAESRELSAAATPKAAAPPPPPAPPPAPPPPPEPPVAAVAAEPLREPVYHDGADQDRLRITQQIVDHPAELAKRGQESLRTPYARLLNSIYDAVLITDAGGTIIELNARAEEKFHTDEESLRGLRIVDLISGADERLLDVLRANMEHQKFTLLEAVCQAAGDVRFDADIVVNRLEGDADGRLCFFVRDLSKRKFAAPPPAPPAPPAAPPPRADAIDAPLREAIDVLLHQLNDPVQVLICMAELENHEDYRRPLAQIESTLKQLLACVSGSETVEDKDRGAAAQGPEPCGRECVLIVEDDDLVGRMLQKTLAATMPALTLDRVADESGTRNRFGKHHHAVIVLDARIPGFRGEDAFGMLEAICAERNWRMPTVVFCSDHSAIADVRAFLGAKPEHVCLAKPFKPDELVQAVRQGLARHA